MLRLNTAYSDGSASPRRDYKAKQSINTVSLLVIMALLVVFVEGHLLLQVPVVQFAISFLLLLQFRRSMRL